MAFEQFLRDALAATDALVKLHQNGLIHQGIRPDTLHIDPQTNRAEFSALKGTSAVAIENLPSEWLPYIAPEQTGRFEGTIDHRVDLYALGMVLYERWAKTLPFHADDALGWVHCHIARAPRPLADAAPETPEVVSAIVMKLLAKSPDERYQGARGLAFDLSRCLTEFTSTGSIEPFALGTRDVWDKLRTASHLYGREAELAQLRAAVGRVATTKSVELLLVTGPSGIGKTALVRELQKNTNAYFLWGQFEQQKRDVPYVTIGQAFGDLVRQSLARPDGELAAVRGRLLAALGANAQLVIEIIPQLELVTGKQPTALPVSAADAQLRINTTFASFLEAYAVEDRPIVLLLDDLQWADLGSLDLLQHLLTRPGLRNLLVVFAYRSAEVAAPHPFATMLKAIGAAGTKLASLELAPLPQHQLVELLVGQLGCERVEAEPLAAVLWAKTNGNPFFASQLLAVLHEERLIRFDPERWAWRWNIADIEAKELTDDVVELMVAKLQRLPAATLEMLKLAACIGQEIPVDLVAALCEKTPAEIRAELEPAIAAGILLPRLGGYRFLHDRIAQAAYSLVPTDARAAQHLKIGWLLLTQTPAAELDGLIFDIVGQLNRGAENVAAPEERRRIAELDLRAGRKAKAAAAARTAATYLTMGITLLPADCWDTDYAVTYDLHLELAECEFSSARFEEADRLCTLLVDRSRTAVDRAAAYRIKILLATAQMDNTRAIAVGRKGLAMLAIDLPESASDQDVLTEVAWVRDHIPHGDIEALRALPAMTDPETRAAMALLSAMHAPTLYVSPHLNRLMVVRMVRLSIMHGNAPASVHGYVLLGLILCSKLDEFHDAYRFGRLGCDMSEQPGFTAYAGEAMADFAVCIAIWSRHLREAVATIQLGIRVARDSGKLLYASTSMLQHIMLMLALGEPLTAVYEAGAATIEFTTNARYAFLTDNALPLQRVAATLRGDTERLGSFTGNGFDESAFEAHLEHGAIPVVRYLYYIYKLMARFYASEYPEALAAADAAESLVWSRLYSVCDVELAFYDALTITAAWPTLGEESRPRLRERLLRDAAQLKVWAQSCPDNYECRHALVLAEIARIDGRQHEVSGLYDQAIRASRSGGFVHLEALACELAGRFYHSGGFAILPATYLREARAGYVRWGAFGKVRQLDSLYAKLTAEPRTEELPTPSPEAAPIDALTAAKASAAISSEMAPDELLATLMRILTEQAGAQRASLLLPTPDGLSVAAEINADHTGVRVASTPSTPSALELPLSVVHYVRRTREKLVLDDTTTELRFAADPYLARRRPKSLLCAPIVRRGEVAGILCLENWLVRGAFTPRRLALLEFLAAISLENALLAADLAREAATRSATEATLRRSEERLQRLVETANVVPWEADRATGRFTYVGPQVVTMLGYPQEDWYTEGFLRAHLHPDDHATTLMHLVAPTGEDDFDLRIQAHDGRTVWLHNVVSMRGRNGSPIIGGFLFDVTERREAESTLKDKLRIIEEQQAAIQRLSTPIIEVWEGVLTLPVLGVVDEQRAEQMMVKLLDAVSSKSYRYAIIDLTGVESVDTRTADHLMQIVKAIRLLGTQSIIVGIRAEVAQTIVSIGVSLSEIITLATLRQALLLCMKNTGPGKSKAKPPAPAPGRPSLIPGAFQRPR